VGESNRESMGNGVARETEIKLKIDDVKAFRRQLKKLGAKPVRAGDGRVHEENVIFDTPQGGLAKHGQLLRIRTETPDGGGNSKKAKANPRVVLTFKRQLLGQRPRTQSLHPTAPIRSAKKSRWKSAMLRR